MSLNKLRDRVGEINKTNGFHEGEIKSAAHYAGLIMTELGEFVDAERKNNQTKQVEFEERIELLMNSKNKEVVDKVDPEVYKNEVFQSAYKSYLKDTRDQELVGTIVRCLDTAYLLGIDLDNLMQYELKNNSLRAFKHDKAY